MSGNSAASQLKEEIKKTRKVLEQIDGFYQRFKANELLRLGKTEVTAIVMAEIITDFYTCLETLFIRISQYFENNLGPERWHMELLHKMTLEIEHTRLPVLSDKTHAVLLEIMKFRHFRRYYFEFKHDWDKLDFMEKKYLEARVLIQTDLKSFEEFLDKL